MCICVEKREHAWRRTTRIAPRFGGYPGGAREWPARGLTARPAACEPPQKEGLPLRRGQPLPRTSHRSGLARVGRHLPIVRWAGPCNTRSMGAKTMRAKSRKAAGQCAGQLELPYDYAAAMSGLHERAMDRRGETARSAVRCQPGLRLACAVLLGSLRRASAVASMRGKPPGRQAPPDGRDERVAGTEGRRMRLLPDGIAEADANPQWGIELCLQLIEEVARAPQASGTGGPGREEAEERLHRALKRRDKRAEEAAIVDWMRAEVREWWRGLSRTSTARRALPAGRPTEGEGRISRQTPPYS